MLTAKNKKITGFKRKNSCCGKKGKSKRQWSINDEDNLEAEKSDSGQSNSKAKLDALNSDSNGNDSDFNSSDNELSNSKSGSNLGSEEMDNKEQETPETLKSKITASKTKVKNLQECQSEAHKQKKTLGNQLATLKKQRIIL